MGVRRWNSLAKPGSNPVNALLDLNRNLENKVPCELVARLVTNDKEDTDQLNDVPEATCKRRSPNSCSTSKIAKWVRLWPESMVDRKRVRVFWITELRHDLDLGCFDVSKVDASVNRATVTEAWQMFGYPV